MENVYTYDGKLHVNISVVGRTGCGKTTFIRKLRKNKLFGSELTDVFWVSKIVLLKTSPNMLTMSWEKTCW